MTGNIDSSIVFSLISESYDWALVIDSDGALDNVLYMSDFLLEKDIDARAYSTFEEFTKKFVSDLVVSEEKEAFISQSSLEYIVDEIKSKGCYVRTVHLETEDGIRAESLRIDAMDGEATKLLTTLSDISAILDHDSMTDEYSRSGFLLRATELFAMPEYQSGYSVVYANIMGFKAMNDLLGTSSGDMIIFMERDLIVRIFNPVLLARFESDHFAFIAKDELLTDENFKKLSSDTYVEGFKRMPVPIKCGVYHITDTKLKIQYMIDRAKLAEGSIDRKLGAIYAVCDEEMSREYVAQKKLLSSVDDAIKNNEFKAYFQPIVDAKSGEIVSAEALIRWIHPEKGMISPGSFIPLLEKEGLISKIDIFMAKRVLDINVKRDAEGKKTIPCAVNLSRVDFYDTSLMDVVRNWLKNLQGANRMLEFEVTESAYATLESDATSFLSELQSMGITLLLDDYGSGMSSLSSFERFEFDVIKLDMGFVSKIGKNKKAEAIIRYTIGLSHDVGAKTIAEGVETKEQAEFLRDAGCDMIQGYYYYKPMPEEEFEKLLDK